jgi:hypothetical protein
MMRVATWNLARCRPRATVRGPALRGWMADVNADVWVLTETFRGFAPGPGYELAASSVDAPDRTAGPGERWVAIWSRLPALPVPLTANLERAAAAQVGDVLTVVGTVLPWHGDRRHPVHRGSAAFCTRLSEQSADWRQLRVGSGALCVAGDFNQDLLTTGRYYGSAKGRQALLETLASAGLKCLTGGEDDPLAGAGRACIDHICVAGVRAVGRHSVWPAPGELSRRLTDHYGSWADLEVG